MAIYPALYRSLIKDLHPFLVPGGDYSLENSLKGEMPYPLDLKGFAARHLVESFGKKFLNHPQALTRKEQERAAVNSFSEANLQCERMNRLLEEPSDDLRDDLNRVARWVERIIGPPMHLPSIIRLGQTLGFRPNDDILAHGFPTRELCEGFACGPGASNGVMGESFLSKMTLNNLTATSPILYKIWRTCIKDQPAWDASAQEHAQWRSVVTVNGSKSAFADKSWKTKRLIGTEPSLNMMFQLSIGAMISRRLRRFGIDIETQQDINGLLACKGSRDNSFCTLDLKSASDSISINLCRHILPLEWFSWLMLTRSPAMCLPRSKEYTPINMISTMGNGFTFPLETLIFTAVVLSAFERLGLPFAIKKQLRFGVYGDDIICPPALYDEVVRILTSFGFTVNKDKSFSSGPFRESCGYDYYHGHMVRGVYMSTLNGDADFYSAINRLNRWSAEHCIPLVNTVGLLVKKIKDPCFVPPDESDDSGIQIGLGTLFYYKLYDGQNLMSAETRLRLGVSHGSVVYRKLRVVPYRKTIQERLLATFPSGTLLAILHGSLVSVPRSKVKRGKAETRESKIRYSSAITLRTRVTRYSPVLAATPCWDRMPGGATPEEWKGQAAAWKAAVEHNLTDYLRTREDKET